MRTLMIQPAGVCRHLLALAMVVGMAGCAMSQPGAEKSSQAAATTPPPVTPIPFNDAVLKAANDLFSHAQVPAATAKQLLVIDPLVDGVSGNQSKATQSMGSRIVELVQAKYPQFDVQPFSSATVAKSPIVLVGTFTGVNREGKTAGNREAFRICLALADLKSGKIVSKGTARAKPDGVDITPTAYFNDSPAWTPDPATEGYIKTCQGTKPGDPIKPVYVDRILAAALVNEAIDAYNSQHYQEALDLYQNALQTTAGNQLRVHNGIYLANWKLGHRTAAAKAFGELVDYGLANHQLAVKLLFKPGTTRFLTDRQVSGPYPLWLKEIAQRTEESRACLDIVGHTSRTGAEPVNERLSLLRARYIKRRLETAAPGLAGRTQASGVGSRDNIIGSATDDLRDALDRRVEFKPRSCSGDARS